MTPRFTATKSCRRTYLGGKMNLVWSGMNLQHLVDTQMKTLGRLLDILTLSLEDRSDLEI